MCIFKMILLLDTSLVMHFKEQFLHLSLFVSTFFKTILETILELFRMFISFKNDNIHEI